MSEEVPTPPAEPSPAAAPPSASASNVTTAPAREKKPGKWRRRIKRTLIVVILIALALRIALFYAIRPVLRKVAATYNVDITFERQEMTLSAADVGFWYIKVTPKSGGPPLLQTDYIRGHISPWELLHGRLHVYRAEADGVDLTLERTADGRIVLLEQLTKATSTPPPAEKNAPAKSLDFTSPLLVEAFRLQHVRMKCRDASVTPPLEALLAMDVRVSNLGDIDKPVQFEADIWSDPVLDVMRVSGQGKSHGKDIDAALSVFIRGLHLKPLAGYLANAGVRPYENDLGVKLKATLKTEAAATNPNGVKATLAVDGLEVTSQAKPVASVKAMQIVADDVDPTAAKIGSIDVNGVRAEASRDEKGTMRVAGLELVGSTAAKESAPPTPTTAPAYQVSLRDVMIRDVEADLRDASVNPPTDVKFVVNQIHSKSGLINPYDPNSVIPIEASMSLPGLAQTVTLKGQCKPYAADKTFDLTFVADGIRPDLVKPYLVGSGIESLLQSAKAEGQLSAVVHADSIDANISKLWLTDGVELAAMEQVRIAGLGKDAKSGRTRIAAIELSGPSIDVVRDAAGRIIVSGVRYTPQATQEKKVETVAVNSFSPKEPATKPVFADILPRLEIDRLVWQGLHLHLRDDTKQPPTVIAIDDAGIEGNNLLLDLTAGAETKPGKLKLHLNSPQLAKKLELDATLNTALGKLAAEFAVRGDGLNTKSLAPYLAPLGIEPLLTDGALRAKGEASFERQPDHLAAGFSLSETQLSDGGKELGGLDQLRIADVSVAGSSVDVKSVELKRPRINVARDADGALIALGVRLVPATQPTKVASAPPPTTAPVGAPATSPVIASTAPVQPAAAAVFTLGTLQIDGAELGWSDHMPATPANIRARASLAASNIVLGKKAEPLSFRASLSVDDLLKQATAAGRFDASPGALSLLASLEANGVAGAAVAPYLPPGIELATKDGRFKASIEADWADQPAGGNRAKLVVQKLDWRDGQQSPPLLAFDAFRVAAGRIDPAANTFAVDEIALAGLTTRAQQAKDGSTQALGLRIGTPKPADPGAAIVKDVQTATPTNGAQPDGKSAGGDHANGKSVKPDAVATTAPATAPSEGMEVAQLVTEARRPLPAITLQKLDLNIRSATLENLSTPDAAPIELQNVSLKNAAPVAVGGPNAATQPPVKLALSGKVAPVVDQFVVNTEATPFANAPAVLVEVRATGIRGKGLTDLVPSLREQMNGDKLVDGRFGAKFGAQVKYDRRGPRDFDLSRGFQTDFNLEQVQFRDQVDGPVLAGLDSMRAEKVRIEPKNGNVLVRLLELERPQFRAMRDAEGIHALGLLIPVKQPTTAPSESAATQPVEPSPSMAETAPPPPNAEAPSKPAGEVRIDRLTLVGLDVRIEDRAVQPPTVIPLNNMDLEVRDFTTLALVEPRAIRFAMTMNADKVPLPIPEKEQSSGGGLIGAIGAIGSAASGNTQKKEAGPKIEERELLSQITWTGRVALYPKLNGYVKGSINGVELAGFEGEARQAGVAMTGGVYDGTFDIRLENGDLHAKTKSVVTDLNLKEPANGPISKAVKAPAPLDAVVGALEDVSGAITIPIEVSLKQGNVNKSEIVGAAVAALGPIMATAVTNAPLKVAAGATQIIGLKGMIESKDNEKKKARPPTEIEFTAGGTDLDPQSRAKLVALLDEAKRNQKLQLTIRHEIGTEDVAIATARANPSREDCQALVTQLRAKRTEANEDRAKLASQVEAQFASSAGNEAAASLQKLRERDQEIAQLESSLDQVLELLRPGANHQAPRRTRAACLQISEARTQAVKQLLSDPQEKGLFDRIHINADRMSETPTSPRGKVFIIAKG